jgi:plastocyanin
MTRRPPHPVRHPLAAALAVLTLGLTACTGGGSAPQEAVTVTEHAATVTVDNDVFTPSDLTVPAGATVTWAWADGARTHNVVGEGFASETRSEGTFAHRFDAPGTYDYECTLHAGMTGTLTVTP